MALTTTQQGLGWEHQKLRATLLPLAIGKPCPLGCGRVLDRTAHLDHIVARAHGGLTIRSNVRIICQPCNNKRGQAISSQTRRRMRVARYNSRQW